MSDPNHYEKLGVDENASFDEIREAKELLQAQHAGDRKELEAIEAAYDAILMDRLRMRQEGKIKVPDRIRFPERTVEPVPDVAPPASKATPAWFQNLIDTPSQADILWPAGLFLGAGLLSISAPPVGLALGVGFSLYFLNRKERKFGRAALLTLVGLFAGIFLGLQLSSLLLPQLQTLGLSPESFAALVTFVLLWVLSSFFR